MANMVSSRELVSLGLRFLSGSHSRFWARSGNDLRRESIEALIVTTQGVLRSMTMCLPLSLAQIGTHFDFHEQDISSNETSWPITSHAMWRADSKTANG